MTTKLERIETKLEQARKDLDKAIVKRDTALNALIKATAQHKLATRAIARLAKQRLEERKQERLSREGAAERAQADGPVPRL
jgi:hypothetical protein